MSNLNENRLKFEKHKMNKNVQVFILFLLTSNNVRSQIPTHVRMAMEKLEQF